MKGRTLMVQGSSSAAGKSLLVTGLCHLFACRGIRVAPFKSQNMSNNAAVCADGAEIGRAQAVQAFAAGLAPSVDMNPILIKPEARTRSQVILMGRPWMVVPAPDYSQYKRDLWEAATGALDRLRSEYDLVIIEGAGSPAELNLKEGDIANMAIACYAKSPVLLVGDIDRGGIFAQLLGTLWLLPPEEQALVRGLVVNKFRGDISLFGDGVRILEEKGAVPVLGVLPFLHDLYIPEEDAVALDHQIVSPETSGDEVDIGVIHLPLIANFDDFDPLRTEPGVRLRYVGSPKELGEPQAVIIPGSKSTAADLNWMKAQGFAEAISEYARNGGNVVGVCGGYQMLGEVIRDPEQVEADRPVTQGLGLLPIETTFSSEKATHQAKAQILNGPGWLGMLSGQTLEGYEIHMGRTRSATTWLAIQREDETEAPVLDGAIRPDGRVWGCYMHGLFANDSFRRAWLQSLGWRGSNPGNRELFQESLARLADTLEECLDMDLLEEIIWGNSR